jgi:hypothetical protein
VNPVIGLCIETLRLFELLPEKPEQEIADNFLKSIRKKGW